MANTTNEHTLLREGLYALVHTGGWEYVLNLFEEKVTAWNHSLKFDTSLTQESRNALILARNEVTRILRDVYTSADYHIPMEHHELFDE